jgi:Organic radical activating enzymes
VLSGGNPALLDLKVLLAELFSAGYSTMVETQGTVWKQWLTMVDDLCVSPKPPSSGNETTPAVLHHFFDQHWENLYNPYTQCYLKIVVFDDADYEYARRMHKEFDNLQMFVSVGNEDPSLPTVGNPHPMNVGPGQIIQTRDTVLEKMRWLMEKVSNDLSMREVRVTPQMHVLAWGNERGR